MGMKFVNPSKKARAFAKLIAPIVWFHDDSNLESYKFRAHTEKPNIIIGHWAEDGSPYEITCPPQLRDTFITVLNLAHRIYVK